MKKKFVVENNLGLHARPAALFVKTASRFRSDITLQKGKHKVSGKSIMEVMMLAAGSGSKVTIRVSGPDAHTAMKEIERLFARKFEEKG